MKKKSKVTDSLKAYQRRSKLLRIGLSGIEEDIDGGLFGQMDEKELDELLKAFSKVHRFLKSSEAAIEAQIDDFENEEN